MAADQEKIKLDVFGRHMELSREDSEWVAYVLGPDGKRRRLEDMVIPDGKSEAEVIQYIADVFHEFATMERPEVRRI